MTRWGLRKDHALADDTCHVCLLASDCVLWKEKSQLRSLSFVQHLVPYWHQNMTHCRHLPSGEPHINNAFFSTDTLLTANVLIITFVCLIESAELTPVQPLHIVPFGCEPWHKITEHYAWNYALNAHWSSFIKMFRFSWIWATFSLYYARQQSRHAQATQLLLRVSK